LARAGAQTVVSSRTVAKRDSAVEEIEAIGGSALAMKCDVQEKEDIDACVARTLDTYGGIDILVNAVDDSLVDSCVHRHH
jgi:NAD(P)-dependent dehydrogenase (short-subunit alcohol dehydrogenase family)